MKPLAAINCPWVSTIQAAGVFLKRWYIWNHSNLLPTNGFESAGALVEDGEEWLTFPSARAVQWNS
eukprot:12933161-Prorocentrum_lima.AAC.1